jgi:hypothetical protein
MIEKMTKFFENEYNRTRLYVLSEDKESFPIPKSEVVWNTIHRCFGVSQFVAIETVEYSKIEPIYEFYREKLINLLDEIE